MTNDIKKKKTADYAKHNQASRHTRYRLPGTEMENKTFSSLKPALLMLLVLFSMAAFLTPNLEGQSKGWGSDVISGSVKDDAGQPISGVQIYAEFLGRHVLNKKMKVIGFVDRLKRPIYTKKLRTGKNGKWIIMGVKGGSWRFVISHENYGTLVINKYIPINWRASDAVHVVLPKAGHPEARTSKELYLQARKEIYKNDWKKALGILNLLPNDIHRDSFADEVLYWQAYTAYKYGLSIKDTDTEAHRSIIADALKALTRMTKKLPDSDWADDAGILRVEVLYYLIEKGEKKYMKNLWELASANGKKEVDSKIAALDILIRLDPKNTLPILKPLLFESKDTRVRQQALLVLSRYPSKETTKILERISTEDPDQTIKKRASMMLKMMKDNS